MRTIVISNIKGGVGKTTTAVNVAYILARDGKKVLFIDSDFQMNATQTLGAKSGEGVATLYDALINKTDIKECIQHSRWDNLDIIASDDLISEAGVKLMMDTDGIFAMKDVISQVNDYDFVIIDTSPQTDIILRACLITADEIIIPVFADSYSASGMSRLTKEISAAKKRMNQNLHVAGILLCNVEKNTRVAGDMTEEYLKIADFLGTDLFKTRIKKDIKVSEAITRYGMPVVAWKPNCNASMNYEELVEELIEKGVV